MNNQIWVKIGISIGLSYIALFGINAVGDMMGAPANHGADHGAGHGTEQIAEHTAPQPHADTGPGDTGHGEPAAASTSHSHEGDAETPAETVAQTMTDMGHEAVAKVEQAVTEAVAPVVAAAGDIAAGAKSAKRKCGTCHTFGQGDGNKVGPNLFGVWTRGRGAAEGFKYSKSLGSMGGSWTEADLDAFLTDPKAFAPGSRMSAKVRKAEERANYIAWLKSLN